MRRLVSSMQMKRVELRARDLHQPLQTGVNTSGECEEIVYAARHVTHSLRPNNSHALLQVDLQNGFNLVSWKAFLKQVHVQFPDLYEWVAY